MTSYPSLKRSCAATLTVAMIGAALYVVYRQGGENPIDPVLAAQGPKNGGDWLMFGGTPSRNMVNPAIKGLPEEWDIDPQKLTNIKWIADLGSKAYGGPVISNGRVFIGTNNQNPRDKKWVKADGTPIDLGVVMSFDEANGKFQWQAVFEKLPGGQVVDWPYEGICSTPHIEGDKMYYVSNRCEVVCANVKDGTFVWKLDMIGKLDVFPHNISDCSPLLIGDYLWVVTSNGVDKGHLNVPSPNAPSFIKVSKKDGSVVWQDNTPTKAILNPPKGADLKNFFKDLVNRGELIQHGQWANPSYGIVNGQPQVVFPGGDGWIYSYDADGKLIWKFDCNPKDSKYELLGKGTRNDFIATPVIYKNRVYIGVGQDPEHEAGVGHLYCIDMTKKGDVSPELVTDASVFPPKTKTNPNTAQIWHYGGVITDPKERAKLKRNYYFGRTMSTCAIHEDILYVSELSGLLHCLDANKGTVHWTYDTRAPIWSSPYYADGKVYLGTEDKVVYVFKHGTKLEKLAENEMDSAISAPPSAANGVLYVMTANKLYAIATKK
jgi:outer membrane protein assembly factor BamB